MSIAVDPSSISTEWLREFSAALASNDAPAVAALFHTEGWLRDVLTFSWDNRSLKGREKIATYLSNRITPAAVSNLRQDPSPYVAPKITRGKFNEADTVEFGFLYETKHTIGRGYASLVQDSDGEWRALLVGMLANNLKGHEESQGPTLQVKEEPGQTYAEVYGRWREEVEANPNVLIVGAGQTGLQIAARFKQMGIPSILIERHARVGDNWRKRYHSLALHTIREQHQFLYQPYPANWPLYTPRDKLADWMESYVNCQEIITWTSSTIVGRPYYDTQKKRWKVMVNRNGSPVELHPAHIVWATGALGKPNIPPFAAPSNLGQFKGLVFHSVEYMDAKPFAGKRAVVVGAANTGIDIAQDLCLADAAEVTMVQRSETCVVSRDTVAVLQRRVFPLDVPIDTSDFKFFAVPIGYMKEQMIKRQPMQWAMDKPLHDKLKGSGLKLGLGPEGQGHAILILERFGGIWLDKGGADLIQAGKIKIKHGVEPVGFSEDGLIFSDSSKLPCDVVILATGYQHMRESLKDVFGADVIDQIALGMGFDEEGEFNGIYRPSGHPGLWFGGAAFPQSRFMSKHLGMLIQASELGLLESN